MMRAELDGSAEETVEFGYIGTFAQNIAREGLFVVL
jgi:hypothetical protein